MRKWCMYLGTALSDGESYDIYSVDLFSELRVLQEFIPEGTSTALQALQFLKSLDGAFPNTAIAYWILLTIPVTAASRSEVFPNLKMIKNYLRTTMSQERLGGRAILSIETEVASNLDYHNLIAEFATGKSRWMDFRIKAKSRKQLPTGQSSTEHDRFGNKKESCETKYEQSFSAGKKRRVHPNCSSPLEVVVNPLLL
ncbi:hypothetical protein KIL84_001126 [Mauremys mutica]|uniref:HAT C-terminal dimerisation domain-containing protein n=1 Tax=Mauremys mutica TaxID=74926 RepID=A0A9D3WZP9_9SAUR|nr:hypothetical protein KIL84_001126 [Mauremys mutica]